jgi:hypothetical protein
MEKVIGLPVPNAMIDPLDAPTRENQLRVAWAVVTAVVGWGTLREVTSLADVPQPIRSHMGTIIFGLTVLAVVLGVAAVTEFITTRYVTATRRVTQMVVATAIYLRAAARRIGYVFSAVQTPIEVVVAGCRPQEHGDTGPAPPGGERAPRPQRANLICCADRRSKEAGHRVAGLRLTIN